MMSDVDEQYVATVDNQEMLCSHARNLCKRSTHCLLSETSSLIALRLRYLGRSVLCRFCWLALVVVRERMAVLACPTTRS